MKRIMFVLFSLFITGGLFAQPLKPVKKSEINLIPPQEQEILDAAKNDDLPELKKLLNKPLGRLIINTKDKDLRTPLMFAAKNQNLEMVQILLQNGANANQTDKQGRTALEYAVLVRNLPIFNAILDRADVSNPTNMMTIHELVMGSKNDKNFEYIQAYVLAWQKSGRDILGLLWSRWPGEEYDADGPSPVLEDELAHLVNPKTKAFFASLHR